METCSTYDHSTGRFWPLCPASTVCTCCLFLSHLRAYQNPTLSAPLSSLAALIITPTLGPELGPLVNPHLTPSPHPQLVSGRQTGTSSSSFETSFCQRQHSPGRPRQDLVWELQGPGALSHPHSSPAPQQIHSKRASLDPPKGESHQQRRLLFFLLQLSEPIAGVVGKAGPECRHQWEGQSGRGRQPKPAGGSDRGRQVGLGTHARVDTRLPPLCMSAGVLSLAVRRAQAPAAARQEKRERSYCRARSQWTSGDEGTRGLLPGGLWGAMPACRPPATPGVSYGMWHQAAGQWELPPSRALWHPLLGGPVG